MAFGYYGVFNPSLVEIIPYHLGQLFSRSPSRPAQEQHAFSEFYGTYKGFTPSDSSPILLAEMEIAIDVNNLNFRVATGDEILSETSPTELVSPLTLDELAEIYPKKSEFFKRSVGFKSKRPKGINMVFLPDAKKYEFGLGLQGSMADWLGPTVLYSPAQIERGEFDAIVAKIEKRYGSHMLPRFQYDGKPQPESKA